MECVETKRFGCADWHFDFAVCGLRCADILASETGPVIFYADVVL